MERLKPGVILVDVTMVGVRLAAVLALIRGAETALIALAVRGAAMCTDLLLAGADDCLPAEYAPEELTARVIAVVRRSYRAASISTTPRFSSRPRSSTCSASFLAIPMR